MRLPSSSFKHCRKHQQQQRRHRHKQLRNNRLLSNQEMIETIHFWCSKLDELRTWLIIEQIRQFVDRLLSRARP